MNNSRTLELLEKNLYPVIGTNPQEYIPYDIIAPHERQAERNHGQTLLRLAERGGLSWPEILAVLMDKPWRFVERISAEKAREIVLDLSRKEA